MKRFFIAGTGIAVILGVVVFFVLRKDEPAYEFVTVERGTLVEEVLATGTVKPAEEVMLSFAAAGRVSKINVAVGDKVEAGQELARLDTASTQAQVRQAEAALATARANYNQKIAGASDEDIQVTAQAVASAETSLVNARDAADKALEKEYLDAFNTIQNASVKSDGAMSTLDDYMEPCASIAKWCWKTWGAYYISSALVQNAEASMAPADSARNTIKSTAASIAGSTATASIDAALVSLQTNIVTIRTAVQATYNALQTDTDKDAVQAVLTDLDIYSATLRSDEQAIASVKSSNDASINNAEATLASAKAQLALKQAAPRQVDLAALEAQIASASANLDAARAALGDRILKSPSAAIVTKVDVRVGEIASVTVPALGLISRDPFSIEAQVPEADIARISQGDQVGITLDAVPDAAYSGSVFFIDPAQKLVGGVVTYRLQASIETDDERVRAGMTANLNIETEKAEDVLFVPQRSIIEEGGKRYVRTVAREGIERIEVSIGIRTLDGMVEITEGLSQGQEIINYEKK
ncbi:MAG: hypothetical protein A2806_00100 [Candidatus Terrybacteria bacterium RIFCSPHIGHO2_01_FULL_48_17]|uniref:CusB-like beta-barrel domain-containing protein n=1 Tax=Candidatus Terrybacteria bacterium RIFCSPHIGHO2_01_FULL_48_17 TaxID=1802362 RepID=A0A1G2PJR3_9BACT|nr:MAG: hypothetical protein A2806_00100 [Candidatus Terrybacteria bacterium RIFCSPHIGHO2_01_FULL_48_17]OHA53002.1 MAG: hypothetical protein A3A30_01730 [Candidatus Terrybacteria bacterium RIFCSPLOWO2_01_FULL_48_14]